jgi:hypothetical protein
LNGHLFGKDSDYYKLCDKVNQSIRQRKGATDMISALVGVMTNLEYLLQDMLCAFEIAQMRIQRRLGVSNEDKKLTLTKKNEMVHGSGHFMFNRSVVA